MADIVNPDGTTTPVPDSGLETALKSGRFKPRSSMTTVGPDGDAYDVPPEHITEYLNAGHHLVPRAQAQHMANVKEAGEHPIEAGLVGAASGVFPGANAALAGVGGPSLERQGELHEGNPLAFGIGQGVGNVGQAIGVGALTGGLGEGAELGRLGTLGVQAAKDAALFGAQGAQNELNEQSLGDHHFNGEAVVAQAGLGAILGGITAPAIGLAREFIPSPISAAGKALSKVSDSISGLIGNVVPAIRSDVDTAAGREFLGQAQKAASEGIQGATVKVKNDAYRGLADNLNGSMDTLYGSSKYLNDTLRPAAAELQIGAHPYEQVQAGVQKYVSSVVDPVEAVLRNAQDYGKNAAALEKAAETYGEDSKTYQAVADRIGELGPKLHPDMVDSGLKAISDLKENLAQAGNGFEYHEAIRDFRKTLDGLQRYSEPLGNTAVKSGMAATKSVLEQMATPARQLLLDPATFGAGADVNKAFNDITSKKINAVKDLVDVFGGKELASESETLAPRYRINPVDLEHVIGSPDKLTSDKGITALKNFTDMMGGQIEAEKNLAQMAHASMTSDDLQGLLTKLNSGQDLAKAGSILSKQGSFINGNFKAYLAGGAAHALSGGIPGAFNVGFGAVKAGQLLHHPASVIEALGRIKYLADLHTAKIAKAAADFMQRTGRIAGPILGRDVLDSTHFKAGSDSQSRSEETDYQKRVSEIRNLASNPTLLENTLAQKTSGMADAAPNTTLAAHASALASLKALDAAIPQPPQQYAIQEDFKPDPEQMRQFEATYAVATNPLKAIAGSLMEGTTTQGMVALANQIAPQTMAELRRQIGNQMVDKPDRDYSLKQQFGMSMVLGVPVSPATDPAQIMFQQQVLMPSPQPPPPSGGRTRASGLAKLDVAQQSMLPGQARQIDTRSA